MGRLAAVAVLLAAWIGTAQPAPSFSLSGAWTWVLAPSESEVRFSHVAWRSCGSHKDRGSVQRFDMSSPSDPMVLPGRVSVSAAVHLKHDETRLSASVKLSKKEAVHYAEVPCVDNVGSCDYEDVCALLGALRVSSCPFGACQCPFPAGDYVLDQHELSVPSWPSRVPSWLASGDYRLQVQVTDKASGHGVFCFEADTRVEVGRHNAPPPQEPSTGQADGGPPPARSTLGRCEKSSYTYQLCKISGATEPTLVRNASDTCPSGYGCHKLWCPLPGRCWLPSTCMCGADGNVYCSEDQKHTTDCNSKFCGICRAPKHGTDLLEAFVEVNDEIVFTQRSVNEVHQSHMVDEAKRMDAKSAKIRRLQWDRMHLGDGTTVMGIEGIEETVGAAGKDPMQQHDYTFMAPPGGGNTPGLPQPLSTLATGESNLLQVDAGTGHLGPESMRWDHSSAIDRQWNYAYASSVSAELMPSWGASRDNYKAAANRQDGGRDDQ